MKTIILILALGVVGSATVCKGQAAIPEGVVDAFMVMYPDAHARTWTQQGINLWIVAFKDRDDKTKDMAYFKSDGQWVKTETTIPIVHDLPNTVARSWRRTGFSDWLVADIKEVKYPNSNLYVMKVEQGCGTDVYPTTGCPETYNLYFTRSGALLKQTLAKNDDFDYPSGEDFR